MIKSGKSTSAFDCISVTSAHQASVMHSHFSPFLTCLQLPKQLEAQEGLISQWRFPGECLRAAGTVDATLKLQGYVEQLWSKVRRTAT